MLTLCKGVCFSFTYFDINGENNYVILMTNFCHVLPMFKTVWWMYLCHFEVTVHWTIVCVDEYALEQHLYVCFSLCFCYLTVLFEIIFLSNICLVNRLTILPIAKNELAFIMTANWMPILLYHCIIICLNIMLECELCQN